MTRSWTFTFLFLLSTLFGFAQPNPAQRDSLNKLTQADHQLMMQLLGIESLRPGPSGNPQAPNAANAEESRAKTYESVPDTLVFEDGREVKNPADWHKRSAELKELFDREMYGRTPENLPEVNWALIWEKDTVIGGIETHYRKMRGNVDNSKFPSISVGIDFEYGVPKNVDKSVPLVMEFGWIWPVGMQRPPAPAGPSWQEQVLSQGWGFGIIIPTSFQADHGAGLRTGIIGLVNKGEPRKPDDWGTLKAWAWGASRALDFFETDPSIDSKKVVIEGLSRYGKAALVTMAYDQRFAMGLIGSSGAGGAKLLRRTFGEQVENLASSGEYHWFTPNFIQYAGPLTPNDLPVDAHELIALCVPRPVFISVGSPTVEGQWIDAKGMFEATVLAGPVYELLGNKPLSTNDFPPIQTFLDSGDLAFRQHEGGHTVGPNWPYFIEWARKYLE
ncbi:acetylxylan esterase [Algoriphagus sp.]|uniref:glucuronyl esterase domain-containing protein n=1 Tax=Algoriphagus sp. TaxID=1872435 RepID=UPI00271D3D90|nr:acetylxylan esterase [Algoriphagus sp.]MDO8967351.1 acetylxylan esterase [Algoriphagus sp.]MDP3200633.1 acetylxylan esterase [Algoriphagus sp.]